MFDNIYNSDYGCNFNSLDLVEICINNYEEIFKRIFVKIEDCPEWTCENLYKIIKQQIEKI